MPLFMTLPFRLAEPIVVSSWVRNVDIWPTVLDLLGMPAPEDAAGVSLVRSSKQPRKLATRPGWRRVPRSRHWIEAGA